MDEERTPRCGNVQCDGVPVDHAVFLNPCMDQMNGSDGFCRECLVSMTGAI